MPYPLLFWQLALLLLRSFRPDTFQRFAELPIAQRSSQVTPPNDAADPPDLKTAKDQGDHTQLDVPPPSSVAPSRC